MEYEHKISYYAYTNRIIGIIPSLDVAFTTNNTTNLPTLLISKEKPLFLDRPESNRIKRVFVLTNACNLQCLYCFEGQHSNSLVMSCEDVSLGIKNMFQEAVNAGKKIISFSLFGGEPTLNWAAVVTAIDTANFEQEKTGVVCYKAIVTNGVMSNDHAEYIAQNFDFVYVSIDGPKEIFLQQRKPKGGSEVYDVILSNAKLFYEKSKNLSFKVTVTNKNIDKLQEIDDFFAYEFPTSGRVYQPCMVDKDDELYLPMGVFLEKFYYAQSKSLYPKNMTTPVYKNEPSRRFCNLSIRYVQYADGSVLACHRSDMLHNDDFKKLFQVGKCVNGDIIKYPDAKKFVDTISIENIEECRSCDFRFHCSGGCAANKHFSKVGTVHDKAEYCDDIKKYVFTQIISRLFEKENAAYMNEDLIPVKPPELCLNESDLKERIIDKVRIRR